MKKMVAVVLTTLAASGCQTTSIQINENNELAYTCVFKDDIYEFHQNEVTIKDTNGKNYDSIEHVTLFDSKIMKDGSKDITIYFKVKINDNVYILKGLVFNTELVDKRRIMPAKSIDFGLYYRRSTTPFKRLNTGIDGFCLTRKDFSSRFSS